jgi:hypothetical protein
MWITSRIGVALLPLFAIVILTAPVPSSTDPT